MSLSSRLVTKQSHNLPVAIANLTGLSTCSELLALLLNAVHPEGMPVAIVLDTANGRLTSQ